MKNFSVSIFLGTDKKLRLIPQVQSNDGPFLPIPEGIESLFSNDLGKLGEIYHQAKKKALNYCSKDIDLKKVLLEYKSFRGFKSQREFNSKHICISSFAMNGKIKFKYLPLHNGEFCSFTTDPQCEIVIPIDSDFSTIGQAILDVLEMANKAYPKLNILYNINSDDTNIALPTNSVALLCKKTSAKFYEQIKFLIKEFSVEEYKNDFCLISSEKLSCLFENDNLKDLNSIANECEELICLCSYSTVGSYGFFHYKKGKCLRGYLSLDESGTVIHNIGEKSYAEKTLNLKFPPDDDSFANDEFDEINHDFLEKILSVMIKEN